MVINEMFPSSRLRNHPVKADEASVMFVTKCPCDECVPLIRGAGITHIYTTDQDRDKDKRDISYLKFSSWNNISKFIVSTEKPLSSPLRSDGAQFGTFAQISVPFSVTSVFHLPTFALDWSWCLSPSGKKLANCFGRTFTVLWNHIM